MNSSEIIFNHLVDTSLENNDLELLLDLNANFLFNYRKLCFEFLNDIVFAGFKEIINIRNKDENRNLSINSMVNCDNCFKKWNLTTISDLSSWPSVLNIIFASDQDMFKAIYTQLRISEGCKYNTKGINFIKEQFKNFQFPIKIYSGDQYVSLVCKDEYYSLTEDNVQLKVCKDVAMFRKTKKISDCIFASRFIDVFEQFIGIADRFSHEAKLFLKKMTIDLDD